MNAIRWPKAVILTLLLFIAGCQNEGRDTARPPLDGRFGMVTTHGPAGKNMTLLHGDSRLQTDSLPERIRRLRHEISRGESTFTPWRS